jgi:hypothetical protein
MVLATTNTVVVAENTDRYRWAYLRVRGGSANRNMGVFRVEISSGSIFGSRCEVYWLILIIWVGS